MSAMPPREDGLLWVGIVTGPLAWFIDLALSYRLVELGQVGPHRVELYIISGLAVVLALAGAALSQALGRRAGNGELKAERRRWMSVMGVALGLFFALVIVAQALPRLFLQRSDMP
jgi:hypothetical protein